MTKENRERLYKHYKDLAENYVAPTHLNSGLTATDVLRKNAKEHAEAMLKKNPELDAKPKDEPKLKEEKPKKKKSSKKKVV